MIGSNQNEQHNEEWRGVSFEELRLMRASSLIRLEMQKEYLKKKISETLPINKGNAVGIVGGISGKLTFIQKTLLFIKGVKLASSLFSFLKKNKRR